MSSMNANRTLQYAEALRRSIRGVIPPEHDTVLQAVLQVFHVHLMEHRRDEFRLNVLYQATTVDFFSPHLLRITRQHNCPESIHAEVQSLLDFAASPQPMVPATQLDVRLDLQKTYGKLPQFTNMEFPPFELDTLSGIERTLIACIRIFMHEMKHPRRVGLFKVSSLTSLRKSSLVFRNDHLGLQGLIATHQHLRTQEMQQLDQQQIVREKDWTEQMLAFQSAWLYVHNQLAARFSGGIVVHSIGWFDPDEPLKVFQEGYENSHEDIHARLSKEYGPVLSGLCSPWWFDLAEGFTVSFQGGLPQATDALFAFGQQVFEHLQGEVHVVDVSGSGVFAETLQDTYGHLAVHSFTTSTDGVLLLKEWHKQATQQGSVQKTLLWLGALPDTDELLALIRSASRWGVRLLHAGEVFEASSRAALPERTVLWQNGYVLRLQDDTWHFQSPEFLKDGGARWWR